MFEDLFDSINGKWQGFLEWCEEKGLPLKSAADWLEEKGVPSLPVFMLILLLLGGTIAFVAMGGAKAFEPKNSDITITVMGADGIPVPDVTVYLSDPDGAYGMAQKSATTGSSGAVSFAGVPIGASLTVTALDSSSQSLFFESGGGSTTVSVEKSAKDNEFSLTLAPPASTNAVSLSASVLVPDSAEFWLQDTSGFPLSDSKKGTSVSFDVAPNQDYVIIAQAAGYTSESKTVSVADRDVASAAFSLSLLNSAVNGNVSVRAVDADSGEGIANASVDLSDSATKKSIARNLKADSDGFAPVVSVKLGTKVIAVVRSNGYPPYSSEETEVEAQTVIAASLKKIPKETLQSIIVAVKDSLGRAVINPVVRLYSPRGAIAAEEIPENGTVVFPGLDSAIYSITAYKLGYLPAKQQNAQKGNAYEIALEDATESNSAKASVQVSDSAGELVPSASVAIIYGDGTPSGIPEKFTSADGTADFDGLPLLPIGAVASSGGRTGKSALATLTVAGTGETEGVNLLSVELKPAPGKLSAKVRDHFSNKTIDGARIDFSSSGGAFSSAASCTTAKGACTATLLEGFYSAKVSAPGYDELLSADFEVKPGANNRQEFELMPSGVASASKLVFVGAFDLDGNRAFTLAPSANYNLKFLLTRPAVSVSRIRAQVRIGNADSSLSSDAAQITGYEAGTAVVSKGEQYAAEATSQAVVATPSPSPAANSTAAGLFFAGEDAASSGFKYVDFSYAPFEGTKEIVVQIRTKPVAKATVSIQYRAAFFTSREVLRDPADGTASPDALLASMNSASLPISFSG
ncbi:MAG: hypothetical protein V1708_06535, partial [Candidatus Micrarchaeota archaeon]